MAKIQFFVTFFALLASNVLCNDIYKSWHGFKVLRLKPISDSQVEWLRSMQKDNSLDFWSPYDVMVGPKRMKYFAQQLTNKEIPWSILIFNVQTTVARERTNQLFHAKTRADTTSLSFEAFYRYDEIRAYLKHLSSNYPRVVTLGSIGKTTERREIPYVTISRAKSTKSKVTPIILVDGGIHAREWIAPAMALYIIQQLVENPRNEYLTREVTWIIIPLLNPDGYEYTHTNDRFWRKSRSKQKTCVGVDLNRNFNYYWMVVGASYDECAQTYAGPKPFSEPETIALRNFVLAKSGPIHMYISFHSFGNFILYPWGCTKFSPSNERHLMEVATRANAAQEAVGGWHYRIGPTFTTLYPASGTSVDWMKGKGGVPLTYVVELPGGGTQGFDLPAENIFRTVSHFFAAVRVLGEHVAHPFYTQKNKAMLTCSLNHRIFICSISTVIRVIFSEYSSQQDY